MILGRGHNKAFFCLIGHFWCWQKTYCRSLIVTKGCGGIVSPLFTPTFTGSFQYFSYKDIPDLQKINLFTLILFNIFLRKFHHPLPSCPHHPWNPQQNKGLNFHKANTPRGYSMSSHISKKFGFQILGVRGKKL